MEAPRNRKSGRTVINVRGKRDRRERFNNFLKRLWKSRLSDDNKALIFLTAAMSVALEDGEPEEIKLVTRGHGLDEEQAGGKAALPPPTEKPKEKEKKAAQTEVPANIHTRLVVRDWEYIIPSFNTPQDTREKAPAMHRDLIGLSHSAFSSLILEQAMASNPFLIGSNAESPVSEPVAVGRDLETNRLISVSDAARRRGLYVLGRSGTGKSWLLVNLILQDVSHGHGVVFLDPHGNAIDEILRRATFSADPRSADYILYNPV